MTLEDTLEKIQAQCAKTRVRITEFFADFDRLHSGLVTREQFKRVLQMLSLGPLLTDQDYSELFMKFGSAKDNNKVNYATFCDAVDCVFTEKHLEKRPTATTSPMKTVKFQKATAFGATGGSLADGTFSDDDPLKPHMKLFADQTVARGLILKAFFRDFDVHNCGRVTAPQFQRCFPFRVEPKIMNTILSRYSMASSASLGAVPEINYVAWVNDVENIIKSRTSAPSPQSKLRASEIRPDYDIHSLLQELRRQVATNRIRVEEVFRDYDKLRTDVITSTQFASGLGSLKFQKFALQPQHIAMLIEYFTLPETQAGDVRKVSYRKFLDELESFPKKDLERSPLKKSLPTKSLKMEPSEIVLDPADEEEAQKVMDFVRTMIKTRRILLKPYFQDFDRAGKGVYLTKYTTRGRFERALAYAGIVLTARQFKLLCDKYQTTDTGSQSDLVRYIDFCRDVDPESAPMDATISSEPSSTLPPVSTGARPSSVSLVTLTCPVLKGQHATGRPPMTVEEVERSIQEFCMVKRLRIHEFFRDFDRLRTGQVTTPQFASALTITGLRISDEELGLLCKKYASAQRPGSVKWQEFADVIDSVFTTKGLEKRPTVQAAATTKLMKRSAAGASAGDATSNDQKVNAIMARIREEVRAKGILLPPFFLDFDVHNSCRITQMQFHEVLSRHKFLLTNEEVRLLLERYVDPQTLGVRYRDFIRDADSSEDPNFILTMNASMAKAKAAPTKSMQSAMASTPGFSTLQYEVDSAEELIELIAERTAKTGVRVIDFFVDADRLRKGYIPRSKFRSGLDMAGLKLNESHFRILEQKYDNPVVPETVHYADFWAALEQRRRAQQLASLNRSISASNAGSATMGSTKSSRPGDMSPSSAHTPAAPSSTKRISRPKAMSPTASPTSEEREKVEAVLNKLRTLVKTRRVDVKPYFRDFDRINKMRVSPTQFHSVLNKIQLVIPVHEVEIVSKHFADDCGDVDYLAFCYAVDPSS